MKRVLCHVGPLNYPDESIQQIISSINLVSSHAGLLFFSISAATLPQFTSCYYDVRFFKARSRTEHFGPCLIKNKGLEFYTIRWAAECEWGNNDECRRWLKATLLKLVSLSNKRWCTALEQLPPFPYRLLPPCVALPAASSCSVDVISSKGVLLLGAVSGSRSAAPSGPAGAFNNTE